MGYWVNYVSFSGIGHVQKRKILISDDILRGRGWQMSEVRCRRSEVRSRRTEGGGRRADVRGLPAFGRSDVGGPLLAADAR